MRSDKIAHLLVLSPGVLWLSAFVVIPFGFAVVMSFWTSGIFGLTPDFQFGNYALIFGNPLYAGLILKTLRVALIATLLSLLISYPIAYFLSLMSGRGKIILTLLLFLPFWTSYGRHPGRSRCACGGAGRPGVSGASAAERHRAHGVGRMTARDRRQS